MAMTRQQKDEEIKVFGERLEEIETAVVVQNTGLDMPQMTALRSKAREEGVAIKVMKNTLARRALQGTRFEGISNLFSGPTMVASSEDAVAAAKVVYGFAKDNEKLVIVGGAMGATILDKDGVEQLAKMPSLDELRGKLVGLLQAPATKVAGVVQAPAAQLARLAGAYAAKGE